MKKSIHHDRRVDKRQAWLLGLSAGLLHSLLFVLSFPPYYLWPLTFISVLPLAVAALRVRSRGRLFMAVWLTSTLGYLCIQWWVRDVTALGYPLMCLYLGFYPALFTYLFSRLRSDRGSISRHRLPSVLLVPILWTGIEFFRGDIFMDGYPWFLIGHPVIGLPVLCQSADLLGAYFISFLTGMTAGFLIDMAEAFTTMPRREGRALLRRSVILFIIMQVGNVGYGVVRLRQTPIAGAVGVRTFTVCAIQSNVPQSNKMSWTSVQAYLDFGKMVYWTEEAAKQADMRGERIDLFVWPETMCPGYAFTDEARERIRTFEKETGFTVSGMEGVSGLYYDNTLTNLAKTLRASIIVGAAVEEGFEPVTQEETNASGQKETWILLKHDRRFNSAVMYNKDGVPDQTRYDKIRLTPFGEEIPYAHYWPWLEQKMLTLGAKGMAFDLSEGKKAVRFTIATTYLGNADKLPVRVATAICFESSVSSLCRELVGANDAKGTYGDRADILINMTNDGWFGSASGGRWQHFQIGRFRAIENRVPVIRAANTGVSGAIDSAGRIVQAGPTLPSGASPAWSEGVMTATVVLDGRLTLFGVVGNLFGWLMTGLTGMFVLFSFSRRDRGSMMSEHSLGKGSIL